MLYNGLLRDFGGCGEVPADEDVELGSPEFWEFLSKVTVARRMEKAGHKYASTLHSLTSAVKKLQFITEDGQGVKLYRGLNGLDVGEFVSSQGFSETAFMSTTRSLQVALDYSGVKDGHVATVFYAKNNKVRTVSNSPSLYTVSLLDTHPSPGLY